MSFAITPPLLRKDSVISKEDMLHLEEMYVRLGTKAWEMAAGDDELDPERLRRSALTYGELVGQPDKIRETVTKEAQAIACAAETVCKRCISRIVMVGCGDSLSAMQGVRYFYELVLHIPCEVYEALDFVYYDSVTVNQETLLIALSSSGETIRIVECQMKAKAMGAQTLALSNTPDSTLMRYATAGMIIHAQRKGWPTQSSTSAMAMLVALGIEMARQMNTVPDTIASYEEDFWNVPDLMAETISRSEAWAKARAAEIADQSMILFAAGGPLYTCAEYGSAKVRECTPARAMAVSLEEYHHYNTQKPGDHLFLIAPSGSTTYRALETIYAAHSVDGIVHVITNASETELIQEADTALVVPDAQEWCANFVCAIPVQLLGYYLSCERERIARAKDNE